LRDTIPRFLVLPPVRQCVRLECTQRLEHPLAQIVQLVSTVRVTERHLVMIVSVGTIQASGQPHVLTARQASTRMIMPAVVQIAVVAIIRVIMRTPVLSVQKVSTL